MPKPQKSVLTSVTNPMVSVIIPAYNCGNFVSKSLESILRQDYTKLEILIADDFSTDNTKAIIDSYDDKRIKRFHNDSNLGYLMTTKKLFNQATGLFVTFQDADDWSHPSRIGEQVELLLQNPSIGICSTGYQRTRQDGRALFKTIPSLTHENILSEIHEERHPTICYATIMSFRHYISQIGEIYRSYFNGIGGEDVDFLYRMLEKYKIRNLDTIRYFYRASENSITNKMSLKKFDPLVVGPQLAYYLRKQRIESGTDAIETNNVDELERIKEEIRNKYNKNIHKVYAMIASRWASFQQNENVVGITKYYISYHPFSPMTYLNIFVVLIRFLLGEIRYKKISSKMSSLKKVYKISIG